MRFLRVNRLWLYTKKILLVIIFALVLNIFYIPSVHAGFWGGVTRIFKAGMVLMDVVSGSETPNVMHSMGNLVNSLLTTIFVNVIGGDNVTDVDELKEENPSLYKKYIENVPLSMRKGTIAYTAQTTEYALNMFTSVDATDVYLEAFVPSMLRDMVKEINTDTTVEAGTAYYIGDPPAPENAYEYFKHLWGPLWLAVFKTITGLFVLVLVVIGIMMIFNYKIKGQTPISLYIVLRNLVIGFVGAAMSFAFGVFFFNLSKFFLYTQAQLITAIYSSVVGEQVTIANRYNIFSVSNLAGIPRLINALAGNYERNKKHLLIYFPGSILGQWRASILIAYQGVVIDLLKFDNTGVKIGADSKNPLDLIGWLIGALTGLVWHVVLGVFLSIMLFFAVLKMFFFIIGNYLDMGLTMVFAPLNFLIGVIPGNEGAIWGWFKKMFARSLAPAVAYLIINIGVVLIMFPFLTGKAVQGVAVLTGGALKPPLFSAQNIMAYYVPISVVIIYVAYNLALNTKDMLDQLLQVQKNQFVSGALAKTPLIGRWLGSKAR